MYFITLFMLFIVLFQGKPGDKQGQDCGGFEVSAKENLREGRDSIVVTGIVLKCKSKSIAPYSPVKLYNKANKLIFATTADKNGKFNARVKIGIYKIWSVNASYGEIETSFLDCRYSDTLNVSLFLYPDLAIDTY